MEKDEFSAQEMRKVSEKNAIDLNNQKLDFVLSLI